MPPLPKSFQFSQASFQDFLDCQRRFELRYRMGLRWPAVETEPVEQQERRMLLGKAFHQLVQQHSVGLPEARIQRASLASDMSPELSDWWRNFLVYRPIQLFGGDHGVARVHSELTLMSFVVGHPLVVRYDALVAVPGERVVILDWKTSSRRPPERALAERMQTRVYRFLLVEAGAALNGGEAIAPEQVEMVYWFPEFPDSPARFAYNSVQYAEDADYLATLIATIVEMQDGEFRMTEDEKQCCTCMYRSFCDRGVQAGELEDVAAVWELQEQGADLELNFNQIVEIEY
jgi:CRISPR/Cas system-associated exonuclease Cas4 (RecB family)